MSRICVGVDVDGSDLVATAVEVGVSAASSSRPLTSSSPDTDKAFVSRAKTLARTGHGGCRLSLECTTPAAPPLQSSSAPPVCAGTDGVWADDPILLVVSGFIILASACRLSSLLDSCSLTDMLPPWNAAVGIICPWELAWKGGS